MKVKVGKLLKNIFMMSMIGFVLCGTVMTVNAQNTSTNIEAESAGVVQEIPEGAVAIETEEVSEVLPVTEAVSGTWGNLSWSISDDFVLTISGSGPMLEAESRSKYPWYIYKINSIVIGDGVTSIAKDAFGERSWDANAEHSLKIGNSVTEIGDHAFINCRFEAIEIPASVQKIGDFAFGINSMKSLVIPDTVTEIGEDAFASCYQLETVVIGNGITEIPMGTFAACQALTTVTIGDKVTTIGDLAFTSCSSLTTVNMGDSVTTIGDSAFDRCTSLKTINIGDSVTTIGDATFAGCSALTTIDMGDNMTTIGDNAFTGCNIATVEWSDNLESIGSGAFSLCKMQEVVLGDSVYRIDYGAFMSAENLKYVTVGDSVSYLDLCFNDVALESFTTYSMDTQYADGIFDSAADNFVIYGWPGSTAETLANENGYTFKVVTLDAPSLKKITNESKGVHVYWGEVPYASTYNVYRSTTKASGYKLIKSGVTSTNYLDTTVKSGTTYYYKIVAARDSVKSGYSSATNGITYLAAPTFKKVVNVVSGVHVYWNASAGAKTYSVYRSTKKDSGYQLVKSGLTATHYIDTTAKSGTTYYYKIVAVNGSSKSAYSAPFNAITYVGTPDITSRFNKGAGVQLGWNKIAGATGYAIYRKPFEGSAWTRITTIEGNKTFTWMDESVKANNGTVYKYTIRALAGSDMKTLSGCRSTGRTMARLTSRTLNSATKASATSIKCNWSTTAVCNGYEVRFMVGDTVYKTFTVGNYKTGVKTFTGLKAGQTYKIQVRSYKKVDGVGTFYSAWSTAKTVRL